MPCVTSSPTQSIFDLLQNKTFWGDNQLGKIAGTSGKAQNLENVPIKNCISLTWLFLKIRERAKDRWHCPNAERCSSYLMLKMVNLTYWEDYSFWQTRSELLIVFGMCSFILKVHSFQAIFSVLFKVIKHK